MLRQLSRSEWLLMRVCWELGPATGREIHEASQQEMSPLLRWFNPWAYTTTRGIIDKLVAKGYLEMVSGVDVVLTGVAPERKRETIDYLEQLLGDRDAAVVVTVPRGARVVWSGADPTIAKEILARLEEHGAQAHLVRRERKSRYVPLISREKALEEESSSYLEAVYPTDPTALAILEKQIAKYKAQRSKRS